MEHRVKGRLLTLLKVLVSVLLIVILFQRVDFGEVWATLSGANLGLVSLAMLIYGGAVASNAVKWGVLLRAQGVHAPLSSLLRHTFVGVFFNNFLPFLGGDVVRGYGLVRETANTASVAISVLVDRIVGLLVFASAGTLAALLAVQVSDANDAALVALAQAGLVVTVGLGVAFALMLSGRMRRLAERVVGFIPLLRPILPLVVKLSTAVGAYRRQPRALFVAYCVGMATIGLSNVVNWLLFEAIRTDVSLLHVSIFNPIVGLTMALPISIAGLGVNQSVYPWLYGLVGVAAAPAVAASLLMQLTIAITSIPGGLLWAAGRQRATPIAPTAQPSDS